MKQYIIQAKVHTLAQYYNDNSPYAPTFEVNGLEFSHWDFTFAEGHVTEFWMCRTEIRSSDFRSALYDFDKKIGLAISKIALLSQCYTEYFNEPYLIYEKNKEVALFRYTKTSRGVPLAFDKNSLDALRLLQQEQGINTEFYYYWNDMLNVTGYSAKLLLLCSALEALVRSPVNKGGKKEKRIFLQNILGEDLYSKIWDQNDGIRHRLTHGEYFKEQADNENYVQQAYEKVIDYFNKEIIKFPAIRTVVNAQRNPNNNKRGGHYFIRRNNESPSFDLKTLINGCDINIDYLTKFELVSDREM